MKMSLYKKILTLAIPVVMTLGVIVALPDLVGASPASEVTKGANATGTSGGPTLADSIKTVTDVLLFIIGTVSVIMIVLGGIRYTTSNGDSSQVTAAKNTILYAVIGLVVALLAFVIVNFIINQFAK